MRDYLDNFDTRVTTKSAEVTASLDQRFARFQEALDGRTQTLNEALGARVIDIAKTLAEGGKEVVAALDKRIARRHQRHQRARRQAGREPRRQDRRHRPARSASARMEVAANLDTRIGRFEELLRRPRRGA